jgi:hypothetical protein
VLDALERVHGEGQALLARGVGEQRNKAVGVQTWKWME